MSNSLILSDTGKVKKGNGVEYMRHLEMEAQKKNLESMKPMINSRNNLYYTKMRDDIEKKQ